MWSSFFFSSRRRHTRCSRDWSSDVCSSDLLALEGTGPQRAKVEILADADAGLVVLDRADSCEIVTPSEPRSLGATHQVQQRRLLRLHGPSRQGFERAPATIGEPVEQNAANSRDHRGTPAPTVAPPWRRSAASQRRTIPANA